MKSKRQDKEVGQQISQNPEEPEGIPFLVKGNLIAELQNLTDERIILDFDSIETNQLSLLERARLFVKLKFSKPDASNSSLSAQLTQVKHKKTRHLMVSDSVLPSKQALIKICREKLNIEHSAFKLTGLPSFKDRIVLAIYIYHKLIKGSVPRQDLESMLGVGVERALLEDFSDLLSERPTLLSELN